MIVLGATCYVCGSELLGYALGSVTKLKGCRWLTKRLVYM